MITVADVKSQLAKMPTLTGKQGRAYKCGPTAYGELLKYFSVDPSDYRLSGMNLMGVSVYKADNVPDDGKFYPADYLEGVSGA